MACLHCWLLVVDATLISSSRCVLHLTSASFWMALSWAWAAHRLAVIVVGVVGCRQVVGMVALGLGVCSACTFLAKFPVPVIVDEVGLMELWGPRQVPFLEALLVSCCQDLGKSSIGVIHFRVILVI